jgi:hypothetical protein
MVQPKDREAQDEKDPYSISEVYHGSNLEVDHDPRAYPPEVDPEKGLEVGGADGMEVGAPATKLSSNKTFCGYKPITIFLVVLAFSVIYVVVGGSVGGIIARKKS